MDLQNYPVVPGNPIKPIKNQGHRVYLSDRINSEVVEKIAITGKIRCAPTVNRSSHSGSCIRPTLSDEDVVSAWVENPYWQYFSGERDFQHSLPIDSSSMTRWRRRLGDAGAEQMLGATIEAGMKMKVIRPTQLRTSQDGTPVGAQSTEGCCRKCGDRLDGGRSDELPEASESCSAPLYAQNLRHLEPTSIPMELLRLDEHHPLA